MTAKTQIDRPFRSREALKRESALLGQYRDIANPELQMMQSAPPQRAPGSGRDDGETVAAPGASTGGARKR
ncbi:MAG: hypothetical protein KIT43_16700 [Bauldia sp.]|nr:hypothetical protein [Bauldia sp.]